MVRSDLSQPRTLISARRLARRQPLPGRQGHHWGCIGGKKQLRTRETAHAPRYSATQDTFQGGSNRFGHFRPIVTGPRKIGKPHADSFFFSGGNGPGVGGFCRAEGPHLAQLLPAAPKFRLRRVTLPLRAAHLGVCSAVANGGVAKGFDPCAWQSASECLCLMAVLSAAGPGRISCDGWTERKRA